MQKMRLTEWLLVIALLASSLIFMKVNTGMEQVSKITAEAPVVMMAANEPVSYELEIRDFCWTNDTYPCLAGPVEWHPPMAFDLDLYEIDVPYVDYYTFDDFMTDLIEESLAMTSTPAALPMIGYVGYHQSRYGPFTDNWYIEPLSGDDLEY